MNKHALVIGSPFGGLRGVVNDVAAMRRLLEGRGFEVVTVFGPDATRDGIVSALDALVKRVESQDDAVVVHYSGHGGYTVLPDREESPRRVVQFIVPMDFHDAQVFRGVLDLELSARLAALTAITLNVTTIFDCCHSTRMARGRPDQTRAVRSIGRFHHAALPDRLREVEAFAVGASVTGNPRLVSLAACQPNESAWEQHQEGSGTMGHFTRALTEVLDDYGDAPVSWHVVFSQVRERVLELEPAQRPEGSGPIDRLVFGLAREGSPEAVTFFYDEGQPALRAGPLLGAVPGAVYAILGADGRLVANGTVRANRRGVALLDLKRIPHAPEPVDGSLAVPTRLGVPPLPVEVRGDGPDRAAFDAALVNEASLFAVASNGAVLVELEGDQVCLRVHEGADLVRPLAGPTRVADAVARLRAVSRAQVLRSLPPGGLPPGAVDVRWGRVEDGTAIPLGPGDALHVGERLFLEVDNRTARRLYLAIYDIGISGNVTLQMQQRSGFMLAAQGQPGPHRFVLGEDFGQLTGVGPLQWNDDVPADQGSRTETLVVVVSEDWQDFGALDTEQPDVRGLDGEPSAFERVLESARVGGFRDLPTPRGSSRGRYASYAIDFELHPAPASSFELDFAPEPREWAATARRRSVAADPPSEVGLRLSDLVVHRNRNLWGRADVSVETAVVTVDPTGKAVVAPFSSPFHRIANGDRLPFDDLRVFSGPVHSFLDLAVWVRQAQGETTLPEFVAEAGQNPEFQSALVTIAGLAVAAPQAAVVVGAASAVATVVAILDRMIHHAAGTSIGLYRRSFFAHERFGVGRHPDEGMLRAQDLSLAFRIEALD